MLPDYHLHLFIPYSELAELSPLVIGITIAVIASLLIGKNPRDGVPGAPKVCRGCGTSSPNFAKFCRHCGRPV